MRSCDRVHFRWVSRMIAHGNVMEGKRRRWRGGKVVLFGEVRLMTRRAFTVVKGDFGYT